MIPSSRCAQKPIVQYRCLFLKMRSVVRFKIIGVLSLTSLCVYSVREIHTLTNKEFLYLTFIGPPILLSKNLKIKIYRTIILPIVLHGCETWLLILREERRLRVFENRVLRRVFGSERDKVTGELRKLPNEELRDL